MKVIELDLEELYSIGVAKRPCYQLLNSILEFYSLDENMVLLVNYSPDTGDEVVVNKTDFDRKTIRNMSEEELDKALSDIANVKVKLYDGYELAIAYVKVQQ